MPNLAGILPQTAARLPDHTALKINDTVISYSMLNAMSTKVAGLLRARGLQHGDRVALMMPNIPPMASVYYGVLRYGAVVVPMNPLLKGREVAYTLRDSGAGLLFAFELMLPEANAGAEEAGGVDVIPVNTGSFRQLLADSDSDEGVVDVDGGDTAVILYTSGTTGRPKGAALSHDNLLSNAEVACSLLNTSEDDVIFGGLPFFHVFGQTSALNAAVMTGASISLLPPVRRRCRTRNHRAGPGHDLPGRADHVYRHAAAPGRCGHRHVLGPGSHHRRIGHAAGSPAGV